MDGKQSLPGLDFQSETIALAIIAIALLLILYLNFGRLRAHLREWRLQRCLNRIGSEQLRNLVCTDGLDGYYTIDRLALTGDGILLIAYKPYVGNIYCAERIHEWTQVIGQKSFKFENPLFELENQVTALKSITGNVPLRAYLFFNDSATFPKGHPESVLQPDSIPQHFLQGQSGDANDELGAAWTRLKLHQETSERGEELGVNT